MSYRSEGVRAPLTSPDFPTEAADGTPHLTYYAEDVSFVWSGNLEHPIQVCPGGYGEPVVDVVWPHWGPAETWPSFPIVMQAVKTACDQWLTENREAVTETWQV